MFHFMLINIHCSTVGTVVIVWYSIQNYVVKFVSDLRRVGGFHQVLRYGDCVEYQQT